MDLMEFLKAMSQQYKYEDPEWIAAWRQKHGALLVEGLTDGKNYVRLARKETDNAKLVLAFRPMLDRVSDEGIVLGGKLAVFFEEKKAEPLNEETAIEWLSAGWPEIPYNRKNEKRLGTTMMAPVEAPLKGGVDFIATLNTGTAVDKLMQAIEEKIGGKIDDRKAVIRAIVDAMVEQAIPLFKDTAKAEEGKAADVLSFPSLGTKTLN